MKPDFFDRLLQSVLPGAGDHGGIRGRQHRGFIPTGDTALFLLAGDDLGARARWQTLLCGDHPLVRKGILMIMNMIRYASLQAISRGETVLLQHDLLDGIRQEYAKEDRLE